MVATAAPHQTRPTALPTSISISRQIFICRTKATLDRLSLFAREARRPGVAGGTAAKNERLAATNNARVLVVFVLCAYGRTYEWRVRYGTFRPTKVFGQCRTIIIRGFVCFGRVIVFLESYKYEYVQEHAKNNARGPIPTIATTTQATQSTEK